MFNRIIALVIKEILALLKDKKARTVIIAPPIMQLFIFAFAATLDVQNVPIGIINRDNGEKSIEFLQRFYGSKTFSSILYIDSMEEVEPFIDEQHGIMIISIDEEFSRKLDAGQTTNIQLILDGRKSNTAQVVAGYASRILDQFNRDIAPKVHAQIQTTQLFPRNWYNPNLIYYWYNVPCLSGILTMIVGLIVTALSVAREREMGTFDQLLVSPLQPIEILIGKTLPGVIIGISEGSIILLVGVFIFGVPFTGNIPLFYLSLLIFVCSIVGVGLFISSLAYTQQQAILGTFVFLTPAVLLSGFATPIENMPKLFQIITYFNPLRYMLVIAKGSFLKAMPPDIILANLWPIALIAIANLTASTWFFRRRLE